MASASVVALALGQVIHTGAVGEGTAGVEEGVARVGEGATGVTEGEGVGVDAGGVLEGILDDAEEAVELAACDALVVFE